MTTHPAQLRAGSGLMLFKLSVLHDQLVSSYAEPELGTVNAREPRKKLERYMEPLCSNGE